MLSLNDLSAQIEAYRHGRISLGEFEEWFEDASSGAAYDDPRLRSACAAVDSAFSEYYFDRIGEYRMKQALAAAIRPFVQNEPGVLASAPNPLRSHTVSYRGLPGIAESPGTSVHYRSGAVGGENTIVVAAGCQPERIPAQRETRGSHGEWAGTIVVNAELPSSPISGNSSIPKLGLTVRASV